MIDAVQCHALDPAPLKDDVIIMDSARRSVTSSAKVLAVVADRSGWDYKYEQV